MGKRTKSVDMKKDQLESLAASPKRAKSSTDMATEVTETASRKKKSAKSNTVLRRSQRIQNATPCTQGKDTKPVMENIDLCGSDKGDHQDEVWHHSYQKKQMQEEDLGIRNLGGKIDYLTLLLEAQKKIHEAKSMGVDTCFQSQNLCAGNKMPVENDNYKRMYVDAQKKIESLQEENHQLVIKLESLQEENHQLVIKLESLQEENHQLVMKLENTHGGLQAYEKEHTIFSQTFDKLKDAMLISAITKTNEMMFGLSSPRANSDDCAAPAPTVADAVAENKKTAKSSGRK